eukprot:563929-Lingulodinium_polyedra.AAC.1
MWPAEGPHWTPPPRQVEGSAATADWHLARCRHCRELRRVLVARKALGAGCEITVPLRSSRDVKLETTECHVMVTFDGGSRT